MDPTKQILALTEIVNKLQKDFSDLQGNFYKNNFASTQTFNKDCIFATRLKVPHFTVAPSVGEVGDLIEVSGVLYICTSISPVTFTKVGAQ